MESAACAPEGAAGESARQECVELILRLWGRRGSSPFTLPLENVAEELELLLRPKPKFFPLIKKGTDPFVDLYRSLEDLHHREIRTCLSAWAANLDLSKDREFLLNHPGHLEDVEAQIIHQIVEIQDHITGPEATLDGVPCPDFASRTKKDQVKIVRAQLHEIAKSRSELLKG